VHQILSTTRYHPQDNENQVGRLRVPLTWAPVSITVYVRFVVAALLVRCRTRAPRPRMRMGSQL
jgi:hypothetical protein